jgi:hypothetical protein
VSHLRRALERWRPAFRRLHPVGKVLVGLVAPLGTIVGTLLALNVIHPFGGNALAEAAERTQDAATAAITVRFASEDKAGTRTAFDATGEYDYSAGRGRLRYDFADTPGVKGLKGVEARFHGQQVYLRLGGRKAVRPWVHADLATAQDQLAEFAASEGRSVPSPELASLEELDFNDPSRVLRELKHAGSFEKLGRDRVLGVPTTRYRAEIAQRRVVTAHIDDDQLVRRLHLVTRDGPAPFTMTMDFRKFGPPVKAETPPPERVRELDELLQALLQQR